MLPMMQLTAIELIWYNLISLFSQEILLLNNVIVTVVMLRLPH